MTHHIRRFWRPRRTQTLAIATLGALLFCLFVDGSVAQAQVFEAKIADAPPKSNDEFGFAVALNGDTLLIGASGNDDFGSRSGKVDVYLRSGGVWSYQSTLRPADKAKSDSFGNAVAISADGNTAVIGAWNKNSFEGAAYVFTRDGLGAWSEQAKLLPPDLVPVPNSPFVQYGSSVAISGETVVVGAMNESSAGNRAGAVYVFTRTGTTWTQQGPKLVPSSPVFAARMGSSVSIEGDTAVFGAPEQFGKGSAYVFNRDSGGVWTEQLNLRDVLDLSDQPTLRVFGGSVALEGDTALIGAQYDDQDAVAAGAAYVFTRNPLGVWTKQARLASPLALNGFGFSVALEGDTALIGDEGGTNTAAFFSRSSGVWSQGAVVGSNQPVATNFGHSIALSAGTAAIGALRDRPVGCETQAQAFWPCGAVYVFVGVGTGPSNEPPEITVNSPYVLEGDTTGGYDNSGGLVASAAGVSATDTEDDAVPTPVALTNDAPLAVLPLGDTTVTWTATDSEGLTDEGEQTVTVEDTTAPNITVPLDITEEATSPDGNDVDFATSTSDIVDASPTVSCTSDLGDTVSGDTFPLGTTTVECTAIDASENDNSSSFNVTIEDTTPPTVDSDVPETIVPPDAPISFTATATDNGTANPTVTITSFECWAINGAGKRIDKSESCVVSIDGATITILDSGGVGDHIDWTVTASDGSDDSDDATANFGVVVVNPGRGGGGGNAGGNGGGNGNNAGGNGRGNGRGRR